MSQLFKTLMSVCSVVFFGIYCFCVCSRVVSMPSFSLGNFHGHTEIDTITKQPPLAISQQLFFSQKSSRNSKKEKKGGKEKFSCCWNYEVAPGVVKKVVEKERGEKGVCFCFTLISPKKFSCWRKRRKIAGCYLGWPCGVVFLDDDTLEYISAILKTPNEHAANDSRREEVEGTNLSSLKLNFKWVSLETCVTHTPWPKK